MSEINLESLSTRTEELFSLIEDTNRALSLPESHVRQDFEKSISRAAPKLAVQLQKTISKGRIEEAVIGGAIIGVGYIGASVFDLVKNGIAKKEAKERLIAYYNELMVKQNKLIEAQREQYNKMLAANKQLNADAAVYRKKYDEIAKIVDRITKFQKQVEG